MNPGGHKRTHQLLTLELIWVMQQENDLASYSNGLLPMVAQPVIRFKVQLHFQTTLYSISHMTELYYLTGIYGH